jgi:hypothetical protein
MHSSTLWHSSSSTLWHSSNVSTVEVRLTLELGGGEEGIESYLSEVLLEQALIRDAFEQLLHSVLHRQIIAGHDETHVVQARAVLL